MCDDILVDNDQQQLLPLPEEFIDQPDAADQQQVANQPANNAPVAHQQTKCSLQEALQIVLRWVQT